MPRKGRRIRLSTGIYADSGGIEIKVTSGGATYYDRLPLDSTPEERKTARDALIAKGKTETPRAQRGTLRADTPKYLKLIAALVSVRNRRAHLRHWCDRIGDLPRHRITSRHILEARAAWQAENVAPRTINHRVETLRHLYHLLDGRREKTPCDDVSALPIPKTPIQHIDARTILRVDAELQRRENGEWFSAKTRARFRVLVSTGRRPSEIMRAKPGDVDLTRRVWSVRDGKGGWSPGIYLNDDMLAAWQLFVETNAWGHYNTGAFAVTIRKCGWPEGVRPYNARHSTWIEASERGADLADIAAGAGHSDTRMTRRHYVPVLNSRMQKLGELLEGRFSGFPVVPKRGTSKTDRKRSRKRT